MIGLDTFTGLPEDWDTAGFSKGTFDVEGSFPEMDDKRVKFIPGLFQDTHKEWIKILNKVKHSHTVIAHFDAQGDFVNIPKLQRR